MQQNENNPPPVLDEVLAAAFQMGVDQPASVTVLARAAVAANRQRGAVLRLTPLARGMQKAFPHD